jgi:hypothetical protein
VISRAAAAAAGTARQRHGRVTSISNAMGLPCSCQSLTMPCSAPLQCCAGCCCLAAPVPPQATPVTRRRAGLHCHTLQRYGVSVSVRACTWCCKPMHASSDVHQAANQLLP